MTPPDLKALDKLVSEMVRRRRENRPSAKKHARNALLRRVAVEIGELAPGIEYWIVDNPTNESIRNMRRREASGDLPKGFCDSMSTLMAMEGAFNGYVAFPKRRAPLKARTFDDLGILDYIPVHGGVTYAVKDATACVYGFDTCHINSDSVPRTEKPWIAWQCRVLYEGILKAAKIEKQYLRAQTNGVRAEILQPLVDMIPEEEMGIGALLHIIGGKL